MNFPLGMAMGDGSIPESVFILTGTDTSSTKQRRLLVFRFKNGSEHNVEISRSIGEELRNALNRHLAQEWNV